MNSQKQREIKSDKINSDSGALDESKAIEVSVDIFVAEHCFVCQYAHEIAELIERDFSDVKLRMIDINSTEEMIPDSVFATPTYLLNGRVWSLGNPSPEQVTERLTELLNN